MSKTKGSVKLTSILFASTNCSNRREERSIEKWRKKHFQVLAYETTQENKHTKRERERERQRESHTTYPAL
jgi:hypothetical protein